jgi:hypothetical protein
MRIVFNGREYARLDEMPPDARSTYERAIASLAGDSGGSGVSDGHLRVRTKTRIVVNGEEYASVDEMPADVRRLYRIAQIASGSAAGAAGVAVNSRWLVVGALLGAGLVLAALAWLGVI